MKLAYLNQSQAAQAVKNDIVAILPIGATEVHAEHLPIGTDTLLAQALTDMVEEKLKSENCLVLPCLPYGQVWSLRQTAGTIDVPDEVLTPLLVNIVMSMHRMGVKKFAFINAHLGNFNAIKAAARIIYAQCDMKIYIFNYPGAEEEIKKVCTSKRAHKSYFHACEIETSYMLYLCPQYVNMDKAICQYPEFPDDFDITPTPWTQIMQTAVLGDATVATCEKGKAIIDSVVDTIVKHLT